MISIEFIKNIIAKNIMKRIFTFFSLLLMAASYANAQQYKTLIDETLSAEKEKNNWAASDISEYEISDQYTDKGTGLTYIYIQQKYRNINVFNGISVFLIKENKLLYFKPSILDHIEKKIKTDKPSITPEAAIGYALFHLGHTGIAPVKMLNSDKGSNIFNFESPDIAASPIKVQLVYRAMDDGIYLTWDVSIEMKNEAHWWNVRIDALNGNYIDKNDYTVSCDFGDPSHGLLSHQHEKFLKENMPVFSFLPPPSSQYNVFAFPVEAPSFGSRSLLSNPSDNTASPYGWHDVNGIEGNEYTITRGNNVYAYEDADNNNLPGYSPNSATLQFDFPFTTGVAPITNQDAAITNLFYANNRVHDVLYHLGFDEAAGNFQQNNYGNGGLGNDYVKAEAFDGSGTNNANFSTPADGASGRMQMYLWSGTPQLDGSFDNGVIAHEYGHGVSNRLTCGPSQASCLSNAEQGGEGWSDWLALMMTIEPGDNGAMARGIGTYVKGQPTTGAGIRRYPYSTNMSVNPQTYANLATSTTVHQRGEIWCDAIWDMSWFLIDDLGYNADPTVATAGNNIAMKLVLEGMKLQPCSPGYLDARDAILLADAVFYNNAHRCRIWEAFARRGMGYNAVQGSSNSISDQTAGFSMPPYCLPATQVPVAAFTSNLTTVGCGGTVKFTDQSTQAFSWLWDFGDQSASTLQNPSHMFTSSGTYVVTLTVTNPLGSNSITHNITVSQTLTANVTATPVSVCNGDPVQLNAVASGSSNISYSVTGIPYAPLSGTPINVTLNDDAMSAVLPVGFTFKFFGLNYTNFYICSNGYITFNSGQSTTAVYGSVIPSVASPNNFIALAWNDLYPQGVATAISYFNTGVAPNRKLVVQYNTRHYGGTVYPFIVQAILSEGSNEIEIHTTTISDASAYDAGATTTQGVENASGTAGVAVPGRNGTIFSATNDAYRFTPYTPYTYTWQPGNLSGASQTVNPASTGTYTVKVSDGSRCNEPFVSPVITVTNCNAFTVNLKLYLQGYYISDNAMQPVMNNQFVSNSLASHTDSITVELHHPTTYALLESKRAILLTNGLASVQFFQPAGSYYIAIRHRNTLQTWSTNTVACTNNTPLYDFSSASNKAMGNNLVQVEPGVWAFFTGDLNQDDFIDGNDFPAFDTDSFNGVNSVYAATDMNGDGFVDGNDFPVFDVNSFNGVSAIHP